METKKAIICIDRDGTLIHDEKDHLFLGRDNDWKSKVKILPYVIDGLKFFISLYPKNIAILFTNLRYEECYFPIRIHTCFNSIRFPLSL